MKKHNNSEHLYTEYVDAKEAAKELGITEKALYARIRRGQIKGVKRLGERSLRFNKKELLSSLR